MSLLKSALLSVGLLLALTTLTCGANTSNIQYFSQSIEFANKATRIVNSGEPYEQMKEEDISAMIENYRHALLEAQKVDIQKLNSDYKGFGDHYKDEFIAGIEMFIEGSEKSDPQKFLRGQVLMDQWGDWYGDNIDAIRDS